MIWFGLVWFGLVSWHINHCSLFNDESSLYIYISNIYDLVWFGLAWFHGISTIKVYLMPNPIFHIYIKYI